MVYLLVFGVFLDVNDGLPYVFDNNETFSALTHAANIYHFGWARTFGLPDETFSPWAAAGPYVYTHGGNFPRFFALLLYALGARSPESQIIITTFTVGLAGIILAYQFFARSVRPLFSLIVCFLLMTDYVMFTQWQVVTWHVWQLFFFFAVLVCISKVNGERPGRWLTLIFVNFLGLFYYDIMFAVFVAVLSACYAIYVLRHSLRRLVVTWVVQGGGAVAGAGILVGQVIAMFGWATFLTDLKYTYGARNDAASNPVFVAQLRHFFDSHHIVFWYNFIDAGYLRRPSEMIHAFFYYNMSVYSPVLVLIVLILMGFAVIGCITEGRRFRSAIRAAATAYALVAAPFAILAVSVLTDTSFAGIPIPRQSGASRYIGTLMAGGVTIFLVTSLTQRIDAAIESRRLASGPRLLLIGAFLIGMALFTHTQGALYDNALVALWQEWARHVSVPVLQLCVIGLTWLVLQAVLINDGYDWRAFSAAFVILICGAIAYVTVVMLSPGYVVTTAFRRYAPLTVFVHIVLFATATTVSWDLARQYWSQSKRGRGARAGSPKLQSLAGSMAPALIGGIGVAFLIGYWVMIQGTYAVRLPGDHFSFLKLLRDPPFKGASFVVNNYAAPVAMMTGSWAYFDPLALHDRVRVTAHGYELDRDLRYLWFADRDKNPAYMRPQYFLCMVSEGLQAALPRRDNTERPPWGACSDFGAVAAARSGKPSVFHFNEIARAPKDEDQWSILSVDWRTPPYLLGLGAGPWLVKAKAVAVGDAIRIDVDYKLSRNEAKGAWARVKLRLYQLACADHVARRLLMTSDGNGGLLVPPGFEGILQVGVVPRNRYGEGAEFLSNPVPLGTERLPRGCSRAVSNEQEILPLETR